MRLPPDTNSFLLRCDVYDTPIGIDCGIDGCVGRWYTIEKLDVLDQGIQVADPDAGDVSSAEEHAEIVTTGGNKFIAGYRVRSCVREDRCAIGQSQ